MPDTPSAAKANWRTTLMGALAAVPLIVNGLQWIVNNGLTLHGILNIIAGLGVAGIGAAASDGANVKSTAQVTKP